MEFCLLFPSSDVLLNRTSEKSLLYILTHVVYVNLGQQNAEA